MNIDLYLDNLRTEYEFLLGHYEKLKKKNRTLSKEEFDKLFHKEMCELIKQEIIGEDTYRLIVQAEKIDIKLPSFLDEEKESIKKSKVIDNSIKKVIEPNIRPSYGARSC